MKNSGYNLESIEGEGDSGTAIFIASDVQCGDTAMHGCLRFLYRTPDLD
jgi:hypothetical protein